MNDSIINNDFIKIVKNAKMNDFIINNDFIKKCEKYKNE